MVRAARNVIAATPEEALDAAREVWKDREDVRSVEVWLDGAIVFQEDCEAAAPPVFSTATPAPQRSENGVGAKRRLWPALDPDLAGPEDANGRRFQHNCLAVTARYAVCPLTKWRA